MGAPALKKRDVEAALRAQHGLIGPAARALGCTRQSIYNAIRRWPTLATVREEARQNLVDIAEAALFSRVEEREQWAVQFALKTQGRDRGYGDRLEVTRIDRTDLASMTDEELKQLRDGASGDGTGDT